MLPKKKKKDTFIKEGQSRVLDCVMLYHSLLASKRTKNHDSSINSWQLDPMHLCNDPPYVVPTWKEPNVTHMNVALDVTGRWTLLVLLLVYP